jgi:hypothetical protein
MINIDILNNGITTEQKISAMIDSRDLINNILDTFYGTDREKDDIQRNIDHLNQCLLNEEILSNLTPELLSSINDSILRSQGILQ